MERERRTHRRGNNLLICFSWGSSNSSMKLSNNKLLSSSLSRRLRSKGSMKGSSAGKASPMFRTGSKKKGGCGAFENDEPSSPKVTCIGLVRVKTKKNNQVRKMRSRSKRRGGEVSFRRVEQQISQEGSIINNNVVHEHRNHRWIHLPFAICEALKGFRAELNCLLPCGGRSSSCTNWGREREKASSSCGAVFMRWLFALREGEEKKENVSREVVINHEVDQVSEISSDEIRGEALKEEISNEAVEEEEEEEDGRVSTCVPPSNALLLMRSRSEPYRTSSLATRFWDSPTPKPHDKYNAHEEKEITPIAKTVSVVIMEEHESLQKEALEEENLEKVEAKQEAIIAAAQEGLENGEEEEEEEEDEEEEEHEYKHKRSSPEAVLEEDNPAIKEMEEEYSTLQEELDERAQCENSSFYHTISVLQPENDEPEPKPAPEILVAAEELVAALEEERVLDQRWAEAKSETQERSPKQEEEGTEIQEPRFEPEAEQQQHIIEEEEEEEELEAEERGRMSNESDRAALLPDCLLLMMREPKVSMELSKETWVCSTDFIRPHHHHQNLKSENKVNPINGGNQPKKTHVTLPSNPLRLRQQKPPQPPRSSCSKLELSPEKKPVTGKASEPSVLSRCKSEPIRSSAKLAPEACFWKNMKLEPHRQSTVGVSAAGVGF